MTSAKGLLQAGLLLAGLAVAAGARRLGPLRPLNACMQIVPHYKACLRAGDKKVASAPTGVVTARAGFAFAAPPAGPASQKGSRLCAVGVQLAAVSFHGFLSRVLPTAGSSKGTARCQRLWRAGRTLSSTGAWPLGLLSIWPICS
jgi:hypothetical protein